MADAARRDRRAPGAWLRWLVLLGLCVAGVAVRAQPGDPTRLSATELAARLRTGDLSAAAVTAAYLERIAAIDAAGPRLNAVLEINPEAEAIARALDQRFAESGPAGPLHGVPVLLKANIDTGDSMATHAGSLALAGHRAPEDAHLTARLRSAGAVILGKANLSEWANFRAEGSTSGWSSVGGQTRNPHVLDRNPCGSSSGSAVAVAARLAPLAVGTETDGSIICPSGVNGVVGIKPTVGTVSRHGIIPISHTQDTAGPMARTVSDAALLLAVLADYDPDDPAPVRPQWEWLAERPAERLAERLSVLPDPERRTLDGVRIGVNRTYYGAGSYPAVEAVYGRSLETLAALGATLVEELPVELPDEIFEAELEVMLYEFKAGLNAYLASHPVPEDRDTLAELIVWNRNHAAEVMPIFGQELFLRAEAKGPLEEPAYRKALDTGPLGLRRMLEALLDEHELDALVTVANGFAWKTDWVAGDRFMVGSSALAAMSGFPSITVPAGDVAGLPVGVAFVGAPLDEPRLVQIAYVFEQATQALLEPAFVPTLERIDPPAHPARSTARDR